MKLAQNITILLCLLCTGVSFLSCEQEIKLDIPSYESKIVVEGWIEQDQGAKILLSLNAPFFTKIDSTNLRDYSVTRAKVTVISDTETEILTLKPNEVFFPPYLYFSTDIVGKINTPYQLVIEYQGQTLVATTTIPEVITLDSTWFVKNEDSDSLGVIGISFTDRPAVDNYYRVLTKRIGKDERYIPVFTSVFADDAFEGQAFTLTISRGNSSLLDVENNRYFSLGDTVVIKFCNIDKAHYEFWNSLSSQIVGSANPFTATNVKVKSNIEDGLGIWGGYAAWYDTILIK